ncbi:hypothetical protein D3C97_24055 [Escherichia coli]|nr:hypothetical protein D3C97_24055 [Escherichia coli]
MSQDGTRKSAVTFTLPVTAETFSEKDIQATIAGANMALNILFMSVTFFQRQQSIQFEIILKNYRSSAVFFLVKNHSKNA